MAIFRVFGLIVFVPENMSLVNVRPKAAFIYFWCRGKYEFVTHVWGKFAFHIITASHFVPHMN